MLNRFAGAYVNRHDETDVVLRNQQASIWNIEQQIGQLSRQFNERLSGTLPRNTETNPKPHVKVVTTKSGKIINPLIPLTNTDSLNVQ